MFMDWAEQGERCEIEGHKCAGLSQQDFQE